MSAPWYRGADRLPAHIALALIPSLPRPALERLVQRLIDGMDDADGDPDLEGEHSEDEISTGFAFLNLNDGPGCPLADAGGMQDEDDCNTGERFFALHGMVYRGPGCPIADYDVTSDEGPTISCGP